MNVNDVLGIKLPRQPESNMVTIVTKSGLVEVLRGPDATQFLLDWNGRTSKHAPQVVVIPSNSIEG